MICVAVIFLYLLILSHATSDDLGDTKRTDKVNQNANKSVEETDLFGYREVLWFTETPNLPLMFVQSNSIRDGNCKKQLALYNRDLKNGTMWAVQMFDASVKSMHGIIDGHVRHLGNFDQCYRLEANLPNPDEKSGFIKINSKYCLVDVEYHLRSQFNFQNKKFTLDFEPTQSVWESIVEKGDKRRYRRYKLQLALCVPAACNPEDIELALESPISEFGGKSNLNIRVTVDSENCYTLLEKNDLPLDTKLFCMFLVILFLIVIGGAICHAKFADQNEEKNPGSRAINFLLLFSPQRNTQSLFKTVYTNDGLDIIHGIKIIYTAAFVWGHRTLHNLSEPTVNGIYYEKTFVTRLSMLGHNGPILINGYIALGALLLSYGLLQFFEKKRRFNVPGFIFQRFFRIAPLYLFIILFSATVLPHLETGPSWKWKVQNNSDKCRSHWWTNILFINNYVHPGEWCLFTTWYLGLDFQCFILGLFIVHAFSRMPRKIGYSFLGFITLLSCAIAFYSTYTNDLDPLMKLTPVHRDLFALPYFTQYYVKTHLRFAPYVVGLTAGAIMYDCKFIKWRLSKVLSNILFILLPFVLGLATQVYALKYFDPNIKTSRLERALYGSLHHPIYAFSCVSSIILLTIGQGLDVWYNILAHRWTQPLGRLTYCAFLVHGIYHSYDFGSYRTSGIASYFNSFLLLMPDLVLTFGLSFFVVISVEEPCRKMGKLLFQNSTDTEKQSDAKKDDLKKVN